MKKPSWFSIELGIALATVACFVIIALLDYRQQQREVEGYDTYSSYDYHSGGYRAWYDLLQAEGLRVQRFQHRPAYINDAVGTLIVANNTLDALLRKQSGKPAGIFTTADLLALSRWVKNGGRLIWLADSGKGLNNVSLLLQRSASGGEDATSLRLPTLVQSELKRDDAIPIVPSQLTNGIHTLSGAGRMRISLRDSASVVPLTADDTGATAAWYALGKGNIVVVTDESLFQNSRLTRADNARFAYNLVAAGAANRSSTVAFEEWSHGYQAGDNWWTILPKQLQWALIIFCGAMLVALTGSAIRFGPVVRLPDTTERTSAEYVHSMAQLLRRAHAARKAVRELAQLAHHDVAQSLGLPDSVSATVLAARLRGSLRGEQTSDALLMLDRLAGYEQPTTAELIQAADLCYNLRKEYGSHGDWRRSYRAIPQRRPA